MVSPQGFYTYLERLVDAGFGKRICLGSDQMLWPETIGIGIENIVGAPFLTDAKRGILYDNAAILAVSRGNESPLIADDLRRKVIHFIVGRRTKTNLQALIRVLQKLNPKRIYTDGLNIYPTIIRQDLHRTWRNGTNYIERKKHTFRTHLKRLNRRTICFSKSQELLEASLKIYFAINVSS